MRRGEPALAAAAALALALVACGDNKAGTTAPIHHDAEVPDTGGFPPPPVLGAQIDRMGRPAITTMLIGAFAPPGAARTAARNAYNQATDPTAWKSTTISTNTTIELEIQDNLAVFDAFDRGVMQIADNGCGNTMRYGTPAGPMSYMIAADLFADDELHVDTTRPSCAVYLALEIDYASSGQSPHISCGGRMPTHDVIDVTYSVLAGGIKALDAINDFAPRLHDGVAAHADVKDNTFPFLGTPH
ncbi:MAG TPA: DUF4331 family protein [Kofleriaceae bacterium]|nr:DUF4331 family protein [Kofleriaceae bacterium]